MKQEQQDAIETVKAMREDKLRLANSFPRSVNFHNEAAALATVLAMIEQSEEIFEAAHAIEFNEKADYERIVRGDTSWIGEEGREYAEPIDAIKEKK